LLTYPEGRLVFYLQILFKVYEKDTYCAEQKIFLFYNILF